MTHDELLEKINVKDYNSPKTQLVGFRKALRAAVKLHKPIIEEGGRWCAVDKVEFYPCKTIQAIEKELN